MFNDNLKKYRNAKNMSQEQLAELLYVRRQTVSKWEKGLNEPDFDTLKKISRILEVSVETLLDANETVQDKTAEKRNKTENVCSKLFFCDALLFVFCAVSVLILFLSLPKVIPAHWSTTGKIDRYGNRAEVFLHLTVFASFFAVDAITYFTVKRNCKAKDRVASAIVSGFSVAFQLGYLIFCIVLYADYITESPLNIAACFAENAVLTCSIAMFPKFTSRNPILGVRTKFTLSNETAWYKVNAFASTVFAAASVVLLAITVFVDSKYSFAAVAFYPIPLAITIIYHEILRKKAFANEDPQENETEN